MISVKDRVVSCLLAQPDLLYIPLQDNLRLQILPSVEQVPYCQRSQGAAFCKNEDILVVWGDSVDAAEQRATSYLNQMVQVFSQSFSTYAEREKDQNIMVKEMPADSEDDVSGVVDVEDNDLEPPRRTVLIQAVLTGLTLILIIAAIGTGWRQIAIEIAIDKKMLRLAFIAVAPLQIWLALVGCFRSSVWGLTDKPLLVLHAILRWRPLPTLRSD